MCCTLRYSTLLIEVFAVDFEKCQVGRTHSPQNWQTYLLKYLLKYAQATEDAYT